eukprot:gene19352-23714_t
MGRVDATLGPDHADFRALCDLMKDPLFYVKVSGAERIDATPPYKFGAALARQLVESFPDRCFWGTDWPHPNHTHVPDDGKVALVTGAGSVGPGWGNGRAIAVRFAQEGAKIFAVDRDADRMQETIKLVKEAGGEIEVAMCDVTQS